MSTAMMSAPSSASSTAWLRPCPRAAPVMNATLPSSLPTTPALSPELMPTPWHQISISAMMHIMTTATAVSWDPYDVEIAKDPYPTYRRLRTEVPLYRNDEHDFYALSRFADCNEALPNWETYRSGRGAVLELIK